MLSKKLNLKCQHCGKEFTRYKVKSRPQMFCSRECFLGSNHHRNIAQKRMDERDQSGDKNPYWKGEEISYKGIHMWVSRKLGKANGLICAHCYGESGSSTMNWANVDHKYSRNTSDWVPLCKPCHSQYDQEHFKTYSKK